MITSKEIAEQMKPEILADVSSGKVPETVGRYSELHDFTDANCYGGAEAIFDMLHDSIPDTEEGHTLAWNNFCDLLNPAIEAVDAWIRAGSIRAGLNGRVAK